MIELKNYQRQSLQWLQAYLEAARLYDNVKAYDKIQNERMEGLPFPPFQKLKGLDNVPYVCLRLPTGGGKTLLCTHSIKIAGDAFWNGSFPLTLWLMPTTTIKNQTLETLKNAHHPNAQTLQAAFGDHYRIFDIADFAMIRPQDIRDCACIVVSTFAALRVEYKEGRRVYDHHEALEGHFSRFHKSSLHHDEDESGRYSFANLLRVHRPLVLIDEAHNAKSKLSMEVLQRIRPRVVIEYSATPAKNSNVIQSVTASQLKAEQMIKLPILFTSHAHWQEAVINSLHTRNRLEQLAHGEKEPLRPLVLFQAEDKGGEVTVEVLRDFLIHQEKIPEHEIAIATGEQRDLDNINLFDAHCPIRYIITVQALKEGWDCSFAYVLCSVANTHSPTAVEQLLGRVLRMPYAKSRRTPELNQAYAHVAAKGWPHVLTQLTERLVSMGFERQEAPQWIYQPSLPLPEDEKVPSVWSIILTQQPDLTHLDLAQRTCVEMQTTPEGYQIQIHRGESRQVDAILDKIAHGIKDVKDIHEFQLQRQHIVRRRAENLSPAERHEPFTLPQLCLELGDELVLLEKEEIFAEDGFNPLKYYRPITRQDFSLDERDEIWQADIRGERIILNKVEEDYQLSFEALELNMDATSLCADIARNLYQDVYSHIMVDGAFLGYLHKIVEDLLARGDMDLSKLARGRFLLENVLRDRLKQAYQTACQAGLQRLLFSENTRVKADLATYGFHFPVDYPAAQFYEGRLAFKKHYYPHPAKMNIEEAQCALILDTHPKVNYWVRNLERQAQHAFSLPTSRDWFYPDFVAQLNDGRALVVEYKGEHLKGSEDTREKEMVGKAWAQISNNLFLMMWKKDKKGYNMTTQLQQILK